MLLRVRYSSRDQMVLMFLSLLLHLARARQSPSRTSLEVPPLLPRVLLSRRPHLLLHRQSFACQRERHCRSDRCPLLSAV